MITRLKLSTIEQGLPKYRSMLAGNDAYSPSSFESIATATGTGSSGTITFSSIPSTYQHLQIRMMGRNTSTSLVATMQFNSDTGTNYAYHELRGNGAAVISSGAASNNNINCAYIATSNQAANVHGVSVIDIHDYASTTKNKTVRCFTGMDNNNATTTNERIYLYSGLWLNTNAINSISIIVSGAWSTTSTFALYGIKGA